MTRETLHLTDELREYLLSMSGKEPSVLRRLREETSSHPEARFQIAPEQGQLIAFLVGLIHAQRAIEIGVFTGYSSTVTALALPDDGTLVACDNSPEYTQVARQNWEAAGVAHKIDLRLGPAIHTLDEMLAGGEEGRYDFAFVDADKENYAGYYERLLRLVRQGGLIAVDNVLWGGKVVEPHVTDPETEAIRRFNEGIRRDPRVRVCIVPVGDGLALVSKC